jgi:hypothetical protein
VASIRVIDGLADVRFKEPLGDAGVNYCELLILGKLTAVRGYAIDGVKLAAYALPVRARAPPRRPRSVAGSSRSSCRRSKKKEEVATPRTRPYPSARVKLQEVEMRAVRAKRWRDQFRVVTGEAA